MVYFKFRRFAPLRADRDHSTGRIIARMANVLEGYDPHPHIKAEAAV
jgi:hypothetical protein